MALLAIWSIEGNPTIQEVADFLADAAKYFKHQRDVLKKETYTGGPFGQTIGRPRFRRAELQLSCVHDSLPTAQWVEAVVDAFSRVESLEPMAGRLADVEREIMRRTPIRTSLRRYIYFASPVAPVKRSFQ